MPAKKKTEALRGEIVLREAPDEAMVNIKDVIGPLVSKAQLSLMLNRTPEYAVQWRKGPGAKMLKYVKHGYVTNQLNKVFGFDWDLIIDPMSDGKMYAMELEQVLNQEGDVVKTNRHLAVCGHLTARVRVDGEVVGTITKSGFGSQLWNAGMEFGDALKAAKSDLLKVCAAQIGIALDLYWNDMAESDKFDEKQEAKEAAEAEAMKLVNQPPENFALLIARANNELSMGIDNIVKIANTTTSELMKMSANDIKKLWKRLQEEEEGS